MSILQTFNNTLLQRLKDACSTLLSEWGQSAVSIGTGQPQLSMCVGSTTPSASNDLLPTVPSTCQGPKVLQLSARLWAELQGHPKTPTTATTTTLSPTTTFMTTRIVDLTMVDMKSRLYFWTFFRFY